MKSVPVSSAITVTHILQQIPIKLQAATGQGAVAKQDDSEAEESEVEEGDTLDPQTGLFYRSSTSVPSSSSQHQPKQLQQSQEVTQTKSPALQQVAAATTQTQPTMLQVIAVKAQQPQLPKLTHQAQQKPQLPPPTHLQHHPDKTQLIIKQQAVSSEQPLPGQVTILHNSWERIIPVSSFNRFCFLIAMY
ncbi:BRCA2-interacting transcriptional repressor EMSY-like [Rhincodon typus]|uniref:BRCA2-interacting transcriptional repressor EMSY-like n=1 Tax=Rhincodon typus TaxID=259920 RepID=UPI00202E4E1F|nr:BRCA2-interacting transcriptional repressor EMSY-like [Rhincodon typus]